MSGRIDYDKGQKLKLLRVTRNGRIESVDLARSKTPELGPKNSRREGKDMGADMGGDKPERDIRFKTKPGGEPMQAYGGDNPPGHGGEVSLQAGRGPTQEERMLQETKQTLFRNESLQRHAVIYKAQNAYLGSLLARFCRNMIDSPEDARSVAQGTLERARDIISGKVVADDFFFTKEKALEDIESLIDEIT